MLTKEAFQLIVDAHCAQMEADQNLEFQGIYSNAKAKDMACFKDCFAECDPKKCMAWRRVDADHGYCILVGCSWREGLGQ